MPNFKLRPRADEDVQNAVSYYFARGPYLAFRLLSELDVAFDRIRENPLQFAFVELPVRRVLLRRFPYSVYYLVDGETVSVIAVIHQKHPGKAASALGLAGDHGAVEYTLAPLATRGYTGKATGHHVI